MNEKRAGCMQNGIRGHILVAALGLLTALFALCPGTAHASEQGAKTQADETLQVSVAFDKDSYAAGEKAHAVVTGTNASNEPLRDVDLSVAVPEGYHASGDTQKTVAKMAAGSSQTLDVYLEPDESSTQNTGSSSITDTTDTPKGTNAKAIVNANNSTGTATKTSLASTADPSMSAGLLCVEGIIVVAAGIVVARRGGRGGSTYLLLLCAIALANGIFTVPTVIAFAEEDKNATPSKYDYDVTASATTDVSYDGKTITLNATMSGHKRHLPATANLHFMHINDIHGYYKDDSYNKAIGFSALKALKDQQNPDLLLDAGDTFHGQAFATVAKGESIARLMDEVGIDATTPGNHDWSYGDTRLQEIDKNHAFSILGANITDKDGNAYFKNNYLVRDVVSDEGTVVRVGIFGVIDQLFHETAPTNYVENVEFSDPAQRANEIAATLRNELDCDVVIALTHYQDPQQLIAQTSGLDAVIAGHQHILIDNTSASGNGLVTDKDGHGVALVEAYNYFRYIGTLNLTLNNADGNGTWDSIDSSDALVDYDAGSKLSDAATNELIAAIENEEKTILDERVGASSQDYDYPFRNTDAATIDELKLSWEWLRTRDEPIGHLVTASYLAATSADFAIENVGGIRDGIPEGDVTYNNILSVSPYGNTLETRKLTGAQLRASMERSVGIMVENRESYNSQEAYVKDAVAKGTPLPEAFTEATDKYKWPSNSGNVLVLGGAQLTVDWNAAEGSRITEFKLVGGGDLDNSATYTVAMNNYVAGGCGSGDERDYDIMAGAALDKEWGTCEMALRDFIASEGWETRMTELTGALGSAIVDA